MRLLINHKKYWSERKIDWNEAYLSTVNHPHRDLIVHALRTFNWMSLWEIGVGGGANLLKILKNFPNCHLGGNDISQDAIEFCKKTFKGGIFEVASAEDVLLSDKSCDVMLSDVTLIYVNPFKIRKTLRELKRITRTRLILVEFHSNKWWRRLWLRLESGYWGYNYKRLLEKEGYYDITVTKIPSEFYPGTSKIHDEFAYLITARI